VERENGIDRVKAVATLCVVAIHCQTPFSIGRTDLVGRVIPVVTEWAVPAFFFLGGYVRARTTPYPPGTTRRWLKRLLPVYFLASTLALLVRRFEFGEHLAIGEVLLALVTGSAWGIYYFVPLFLGALLSSHVLARWPRSVPWICVVSIVCLVLTRWNADFDPFWRVAGFNGIVRSPLFWWGYFFAGWIVKQRFDRAQWRRPAFVLSSITALICLFAMLADGPLLEKALARVGASIAIPTSLLFLSTRPLGSVTALLSEYSYEVYLFHFFAIAIARHAGVKGQAPPMTLAWWAVALMSGIGAGIMARRSLQRAR